MATTTAMAQLATTLPPAPGFRGPTWSPRASGCCWKAEHLCMSLRGMRAAGARTVTSALHGLLRTDAGSRQEFLAFTGISR